MSTTPLADPARLRELVLANRILAQQGVVDAFGHVSIRHPEEPGHYLIARSLGPERVTEADLQRFTLDGQQVGGHTGTAYAERAIHGAIYATRPEVLAVCHNHSPSVIPFGVTGVPLRPIYHMAGLLGSSIPWTRASCSSPLALSRNTWACHCAPLLATKGLIATRSTRWSFLSR